MSITLPEIQTINQILGIKLLDEGFLVLFQEQFHYDFLYQLHFIRHIKNQNQKIKLASILGQQSNYLLKKLGRKHVCFKALQKSKKVTDYAQIVRLVLCKSSKTLKLFFDLRKECLEELKNKQKPKQQIFNAFLKFYEVVLQGNFLPKKCKHPKAMLTGIRKLIKLQKPKKKDKRDRRKQKDLLKHRRMLYRTNRIIRDILQVCLQIHQKNFEIDLVLEDMINKVLKERRWMGPNLYKVLIQQKWNGFQIDTLIQLMKMGLQKQQKFKDEKTRNFILRTITNLQTCSDWIKKHPNMPSSFRMIRTDEKMSLNDDMFSINPEEQRPFFAHEQQQQYKEGMFKAFSRSLMKFDINFEMDFENI